MTNERLNYLLVGQFEKKVDIQSRLQCRPVKLGIAEPGEKTSKSDNRYHSWKM